MKERVWNIWCLIGKYNKFSFQTVGLIRSSSYYSVIKAGTKSAVPFLKLKMNFCLGINIGNHSITLTCNNFLTTIFRVIGHSIVLEKNVLCEVVLPGLQLWKYVTTYNVHTMLYLWLDWDDFDFRHINNQNE